ncbi:MAG: potassium-transporting ATPase subunit KdpA, partial [Ilumatobacteraceae bacterium]
MSWQAIVQALILVVALAIAVPQLGKYMANVYGARKDGSAPGDRFFNPIERYIYKVCRVDAKREQRWNVYTLSLIAFSISCFVALYALQRLQGSLPLNPTDRTSVSSMGSFNSAISFVTNTNWQWFSGEQVM